MHTRAKFRLPLPVFKGEDCSKCIPFPGCQNGYCKSAYECRCKEGWSGTNCDKGKRVIYHKIIDT